MIILENPIILSLIKSGYENKIKKVISIDRILNDRDLYHRKLIHIDRIN